jgi:hypothetical protein
MNHVGMSLAWPSQKSAHPIGVPGREEIQQCQTHCGALEGEPSELGWPNVQQWRQPFRLAYLQRYAIAPQELTADLLEAAPYGCISVKEPTSAECRLDWGNAQNMLPQLTWDGSHRPTYLSVRPELIRWRRTNLKSERSRFWDCELFGISAGNLEITVIDNWLLALREHAKEAATWR